MLAAAREARVFAAARTDADLSHDRQLTLAVLKCIEIIGGAVPSVELSGCCRGTCGLHTHTGATHGGATSRRHLVVTAAWTMGAQRLGVTFR